MFGIKLSATGVEVRMGVPLLHPMEVEPGRNHRPGVDGAGLANQLGPPPFLRAGPVPKTRGTSHWVANRRTEALTRRPTQLPALSVSRSRAPRPSGPRHYVGLRERRATPGENPPEL